MTDRAGARGIWTDREFLSGVQYAAPGNLAARQSIYAFQQPRLQMYAWALDLAGLTGDETVVDIGCGNGRYLAALEKRGHSGLVVGLDISVGMLAVARSGAPHASVAEADATALPLRSGTVDCALAMHMLYHVPEPELAVAELRRVTRPGGATLVVLNQAPHLEELRSLMNAALVEAGEQPRYSTMGRLDVDEGRRLLEGAFDSVSVHDQQAELVVTDAEAVVAYLGSTNVVQAGIATNLGALRVVRRMVQERIGEHGAFRVATRTGCLVCR
ncbi:MAG: class I SAM-dependent methyltransferase [Acidimicrobiales bacterium]